MLRAALLIARKDLRLLLGTGAGLVQPLLLGLLLVFVFSLSRKPGDSIEPQTAMTIFWLASAFCLVLVGTMIHSLEEARGIRAALLLAPVPVQAVWLGKALAIGTALVAAQLVLLPAVIAFLGQTPSTVSWWGGASLVLTDAGLAAVGSLLGALAQGRAARESLLSLLLFPLIIPLLLAGIGCGEMVFTPSAVALPPEVLDWLGLTAAFDALFIAAGLALFPFVYTDED